MQVIAYPGGDPVGMSGENAAFKDDANSAAQRATQFGMHHDGIHYFAQEGSGVGLLAMNHSMWNAACYCSLMAPPTGAWRRCASRRLPPAVSICEVRKERQSGKW